MNLNTKGKWEIVTHSLINSFFGPFKLILKPPSTLRLSSLGAPVTDLIGLGVNKKDVATTSDGQREKEEGKSLTSLPIPTNDRPMSLVQELDESAIQTDEDDEEGGAQQHQKKKVPEVNPTPETVQATKTTIKSTTVLKIAKPSTSSKSISEENIRKEFPNMPRKT